MSIKRAYFRKHREPGEISRIPATARIAVRIAPEARGGLGYDLGGVTLKGFRRFHNRLGQRGVGGRTVF